MTTAVNPRMSKTTKTNKPTTPRNKQIPSSLPNRDKDGAGHVRQVYRKSPGTSVRTSVKFSQNRRCADTTKKIRENSFVEEWLVDDIKKTIKVTTLRYQCVLNNFVKCKKPFCTVS
jgi:hypothetical protein